MARTVEDAGPYKIYVFPCRGGVSPPENKRLPQIKTANEKISFAVFIYINASTQTGTRNKTIDTPIVTKGKNCTKNEAV